VDLTAALAGLHATDPAFPVARGKKYEGTQGVSTRVLFLLAADGHIVRGRPLGSWASTLYRWAPMKSWLGVQPEEIPAEAGRAKLVRTWLRAFGPGTFTDLRWWTGWTAGQLGKALADVPPVEVQLDGRSDGEHDED